MPNRLIVAAYRFFRTLVTPFGVGKSRFKAIENNSPVVVFIFDFGFTAGIESFDVVVEVVNDSSTRLEIPTVNMVTPSISHRADGPPENFHQGCGRIGDGHEWGWFSLRGTLLSYDNVTSTRKIATKFNTGCFRCVKWSICRDFISFFGDIRPWKARHDLVRLQTHSHPRAGIAPADIWCCPWFQWPRGWRRWWQHCRCRWWEAGCAAVVHVSVIL